MLREQTGVNFGKGAICPVLVYGRALPEPVFVATHFLFAVQAIANRKLYSLKLFFIPVGTCANVHINSLLM